MIFADIGFKTSETLLGIETNKQRSDKAMTYGFKTSETLLGIETLNVVKDTAIVLASKPLKPF